ncbi:histidine-phosphotransfer domain, HPT domain-containing protein [Coprinopsis marcescibilis]|uniref:Histidine-phosphotransfer domain, HPT domain-containing protein n=1 Tax=Coprinopsis marcescibilis TaxID=230819 RepID=A0A5C3KIR8_COPMA|nr:histidine-phosphotransfer domain, HPT domain-containing protein [Coprinopsis marcescibilis]
MQDDEDVLDNEDELDDKGESDDEDELDDEDEESSEIVDMDVFSQLIELDEDDPDFSKEMAEQYFSQAIATFGKLDEALLDKDLKELSSLGHFLKGSSAALGLSKVQKSCEKIQNYGNLRDEDADRSLVEHEALKLITKTLARVKKEYIEAEKWLKNYHNTA